MAIRRSALVLVLMISLIAVQGLGQAADEQIITLGWAQEQAYLHSPERQRLDLDMQNVVAEIAELLKDPNLLLPWNSHKLAALKSYTEQRTALERSYATTEASVKRSVADAFSSLLFSQRQIDTRAESLRVLEEKHLVEVEKVRLGLSTELTAKSLAISLKKGQRDMIQAEDDLQQSKMQFNQLLGRDLWAEVVLEEPPQESYEFNPEVIDFAASLSKALSAEQGSVHSARQAYEDAKKDYRNVYSPNSDTHGEGAKLDYVRQARIRYEQAEIAYNQFVQSFTISYWREYRNLLALDETVRIAIDELELERQKLEIEEQKEKVGLSSLEQVVEQLNLTVQKELDYNTRVEAYNKALRSFRMTELGQ